MKTLMLLASALLATIALTHPPSMPAVAAQATASPTFLGHNIFPSWSPDGTAILFASDRDGAGLVLQQIAADGSNPRPVERLKSFFGRWSKDGSRIAYIAGAYPSTEIRVVPPPPAPVSKQCSTGYSDGPPQAPSPATTATRAPALPPSVYYSVPSWAPDGRTISFESNREGQAAVYTIRPDGSRLTRLTPAGVPGEQPNWSPDGQFIVFASTRDGNKQLFLMKPDGTKVVAVPGSRNGFLAAFSPDGGWLLFATQDKRPSMVYRAVVMRPDGSMRRELGDPAKSNEDPRWTVDGRRVLLTQVPLLERQPNEAPKDFLLRRRSAERQVVVSIDGLDVQAVAPGQPAAATRDRGLSPDGRWMLLSKTVEGVTGLYLREQASGRETLLDPRPR